MSDVVLKQDLRSQDRSKTKLRRRNNSESSSATGSGISLKRRNACSKDKRNKSKRRSSSSGSSSSSSTASRGSSSRKQLKAKDGNTMSQKYPQSSRDRRNGVQVQGGRDSYIREQRSYSQRESRYKVERFDRTFSNRMYNDNQGGGGGGMRGMNYRQRGNMNRNFRNFDDRRMRGGREMNRNYNNFNRQQGRMNQSGNYEYRRRGMYQRNNDLFMRDRYSQRQRFSKERPTQEYSSNSYKTESESRQYETPRSEQSSSHPVERREKPKAVTQEEPRPAEDKIQLKKRSRSSSVSSSSSSESSSDSDDSSSSDSSSSSEDEKKRKKRKKIAKKLKKAEKKRKKKKLKKKLKKMKTRKDKPGKDKKKIPKEKSLEESGEQPVDKAKAMAPMTKEQWEKRQNVVRKVYDKETGRHRLIKGDGEVLEEIVSRERHKDINRQATRGDGEFFQAQLRANQ